MRDDVGRLRGVWLAIKADTLSIVAFQLGLFGYMALYHLVLWQPPLTVDQLRVLADDADRADHRLFHCVADERLADPADRRRRCRERPPRQWTDSVTGRGSGARGKSAGAAWSARGARRQVAPPSWWR
jgi:hypothetical protein